MTEPRTQSDQTAQPLSAEEEALFRSWLNADPATSEEHPPILAIFPRLLATLDGLRAHLERIASLTGDMPSAINDEAGWYRGQFYSAVGIASRALRVALEATGEGSDTRG